MIGAAIGAGISAIGGLIGGLQSAARMRQYVNLINQQKQENKDWYNRRYNEDYTQTAEAQSLLNRARDYAKEQISASLGRQAVMGGTEESVASTRNAANGMLVDTMSQVAAQGTKRKENIEQQYRQRDQQLSDQLAQVTMGQAAQSAQAGSSAMQAGMGLVSSDLSSKLKTGKDLFANLFGKNGGTTYTNPALESALKLKLG